MIRLKTTEVARVRGDLAKQQGNRCKLCKMPLGQGALRAVLDHDHDTGFIRGTLHNGCNAMLGKVENNYKRYGVQLGPFLSGLQAYLQLHDTPQHDMLHPTHLTDDEKRLRRNARAVKARKAKKETA